MVDYGKHLAMAEDWAETQLVRAVDALLAGYSGLIAIARDRLTRFGLELSDTGVAFVICGGMLVAVLLLFRLHRSLGTRSVGTSNAGLDALTRPSRRLGLAAVVLFAAVFGAWSVFAPLASAALAPGVISPDGHRKTVQHLEGGIIRSIHVREGDIVSAGSPLIVLDDTRAKSLDAEIRERLLHVLAVEARLEAEWSDAAEISFPDALFRDDAQGVQQLMQGQRQLLESRRATHEGRTQILQARIRQLNEQNTGLREVIAAENGQLGLIDEDIAASEALLEKGLERKPRLLALRRERADIAAGKAVNRAKIAENAQSVGETRLQLLTLAEERQEQIGAELADIRRVLAELKGELPSREDILERTVIRAPIAGTVMNVRTTTEGGVVRPGEPLLDIVPDGGELIIDARVRPTDIERITPGMSARVVLTAYRQRSLPLIHGRLRSVSADALTDERTGETYFLAKVQVLTEDLAGLEEVQIIPGMPAEVMLMDGEQSLLAYLIAPILDSGRRSLREN